MLKRLLTLTLTLLLFAIPVTSQNSKIKKQETVIANLRRTIKNQERELQNLKKSKASAEKQVLSLTQQIESRTELINKTSQQIRELTAEVRASERRIAALSEQLVQLEKNVGEIVRSAYRNYRYQNDLTYIFSAKSFTEIARRIAMLRVATNFRKEQIDKVTAVRTDVQEERERLTKRRAELAAIKRELEVERKRLNADIASVKRSIQQMTSKEKEVLRSKLAYEKRLNSAIKELRKLVKGNKQGSSFVAGAKLKLPVEGGVVKLYKGNFAEILGCEGAAVTTVYEGKVFKVTRNKVNNKYDVFIAHGEYISSYANLSEVSVAAGDIVQRNQRIGTIGSTFDLKSGKMENKLVFGLYSPNPNEKLSVAVHFRK